MEAVDNSDLHVLVAKPLDTAVKILEANHIKYAVKVTKPVTKMFMVDESSLYVVRQKALTDGTYEIITAAKMGKEVF